MKNDTAVLLVFAAVGMLICAAYATQAEALCGQNASALCNDGTLSFSENCRGMCSYHGGVRHFYSNCGLSAGN
jgi:hypothetical protein